MRKVILILHKSSKYQYMDVRFGPKVGHIGLTPNGINPGLFKTLSVHYESPIFKNPGYVSW